MSMQDFYTRFFSNWAAKLVSIAVAVLLYFSYQILSLDTKSFSVSLQVRESGVFSLSDDPPSFVRVTVRGKAEQIAAVRKSNIKAYVDASTVVNEGVAYLPVKLALADYFTLIDPLDVQVKPHMLSLAFEASDSKIVPIKPLFSDAVPQGYEVRSWKITPANVKVSGPKSAISALEYVYSEALSLSGKKASFSSPLKIGTVAERLTVEKPAKIVIAVDIGTQSAQRTFTDVSVKPLNLASSLVIVHPLKTVNLVLSGNKTELDSFTLSEQAVQADFTDVDKPGTYTVPLRVNVPDAFSPVDISETSLEVEVAEAEKVGKVRMRSPNLKRAV